MLTRLHVIIAHAGLASRRRAEAMITAGLVKVNGKVVKEQGTMADPDKDKISVNGKPTTATENLVYFLMYKPRGVVSTVSDPDQKRTVINVFSRWWRSQHEDEAIPSVYPVGRLDEESEGLLLLTNDGDLTYHLTHPKFEVKKLYHVLVKGAPTNTQLQKLKLGVRLKEGFSKMDDVKLFKHEDGNTWIAITLHQGLHRQVRRTCAGVGLMISKLVRLRMGTLELGEMQPGEIRQIDKP